MDKDVEAIDISNVQQRIGDYVCPICDVLMLPQHVSETVSVEVQCPSCGFKLNPITDQVKHASMLIPKITEEMITDEDYTNIFEVVADEDSGRAVGKEEETNDFIEDDRRDEESLRRKGYKILSSN